MQSTCAEDTSFLVLGHVRCRGTLVVGNLLVLVGLLVALASVGGRVRVTRSDYVVIVFGLVDFVAGSARYVVVRGLGFGLVVLIRVLIEGGLVTSGYVLASLALRMSCGIMCRG